ncbi:hypothetical protein ASC90_25260 [Rhizobium sp. Root1220]|nr:hypothetical protein ASC90_25260 [Rhizobium sp. Root1220]
MPLNERDDGAGRAPTSILLISSTSIMDRQFPKTVLFDKFFRMGLPIGIEAISVHSSPHTRVRAGRSGSTADGTDFPCL